MGDSGEDRIYEELREIEQKLDLKKQAFALEQRVGDLGHKLARYARTSFTIGIKHAMGSGGFTNELSLIHCPEYDFNITHPEYQRAEKHITPYNLGSINFNKKHKKRPLFQNLWSCERSEIEDIGKKLIEFIKPFETIEDEAGFRKAYKILVSIHNINYFNNIIDKKGRPLSPRSLLIYQTHDLLSKYLLSKFKKTG